MKALLLLILLLVCNQAEASDTELHLGRFSTKDLTGWKEQTLGLMKPKTSYNFSRDNDKEVLVAHSTKSASGKIYTLNLDPKEYPTLKWSWKIDHVLAAADERSKKGDDYPARVYVVFSSGPLFWKTRTLNYVWSSNQSVDAEWPNAFTGSAHMIAVEGGREQVGQWRTYRRNVREDFKKYFGEDMTQAHAVAIMTDTDNTDQSASAFYGDIFFTSK